jgi:hypothetical protein
MVIQNKELQEPEVQQILTALEKAIKEKDSFAIAILTTRLEKNFNLVLVESESLF